MIRHIALGLSVGMSVLALPVSSDLYNVQCLFLIFGLLILWIINYNTLSDDKNIDCLVTLTLILDDLARVMVFHKHIFVFIFLCMGNWPFRL